MSTNKLDSMKNILQEDINIEELLRPETDLERFLIKDPVFVEGLMWGKPRFGHPEGKVVFHIREVLDNVDLLDLSPEDRVRIRLISFLHDAFKHLEGKERNPRDWTRHHAILARQYAEQYISDTMVLDIIELHDEAYYCWRSKVLQKNGTKSDERLERLLNRLGESRQLYYLFFKCDTQTGDKNQAPLFWFEKNISDIEIINF